MRIQSSTTLFAFRAALLVAAWFSIGAAAQATAADPEPKGQEALEQARQALSAREYARGRELAGTALEQGADRARAYELRAACHALLEDHAAAVADYDRLIELEPRRSELFDARGSQHFMLGQFEASIEDFDRAIALQPALEAGHWRRGISYYYAGEYEKGERQFAGYQQVDNNDVENAVWRFLCMARGSGVEGARDGLLTIRRDGRVPMMEIYALYAGKGSPQAVLDAVHAGNPDKDELNSRQFYAQLYLGLYYEATGDNRRAREHLQTAAEKHKIPHYMWEVARVHWSLLRPEQ